MLREANDSVREVSRACAPNQSISLLSRTNGEGASIVFDVSPLVQRLGELGLDQPGAELVSIGRSCVM